MMQNNFHSAVRGYFVALGVTHPTPDEIRKAASRLLEYRRSIPNSPLSRLLIHAVQTCQLERLTVANRQ